MRFELFVAIRYLLAPRRQARVSLVSLFSTIGVAVGVMALVIALALMTGLQGELRSKLLGAVAHIYLTKAAGFDDYHKEVDRLRAVPGVLGAGPPSSARRWCPRTAPTRSSRSRASTRRSKGT
jgi:lipoprotein-releasing system permease protein